MKLFWGAAKDEVSPAGGTHGALEGPLKIQHTVSGSGEHEVSGFFRRAPLDPKKF